MQHFPNLLHHLCFPPTTDPWATTSISRGHIAYNTATLSTTSLLPHHDFLYLIGARCQQHCHSFSQIYSSPSDHITLNLDLRFHLPSTSAHHRLGYISSIHIKLSQNVRRQSSPRSPRDGLRPSQEATLHFSTKLPLHRQQARRPPCRDTDAR